MKKEDFFNQIQDKIFELSQQGSKGLAKAIKRILASLDTEGGIIKATNKNIKILGKISKLIKSFFVSRYEGLTKWIYKTAVDLFDLNVEIFKKLSDKFDSLDLDAIKATFFKSVGFDTVGNVLLLKTSAVNSLLKDEKVNKIIVTQVLQGIKKQFTIKELIKKVIEFLDPKNGLGIIETQLMRQGGFDFWQRQDRVLNNDLAVDLGFNFAVYSGTKKDNTREYCLQRLNKVYTRKEMQGWNKLTWKGKIPNVDAITQCGGFFCRHHLNFVSEETAKRLASTRGGVNSYHTI